MSTDFRGDPAAALLEVLDPEQNHTFNDHYLDLDYDLSDVMFITTANTLGGIPVPLQDRMEIIQLSGYTEFEKLNIAVKYLVPRQKKECGLEDVQLDVHRGRASAPSSTTTRRRAASARSSARSPASAARWRARWWPRAKRSPSRSTRKTSRSTSACPSTASARRKRRTRSASSTASPSRRVGGDLLAGRGDGRARQGQARHHRPAREGDGGERAGGDELRALAPRQARPRARTSTRRSTSTFTSPTSSARTGRAPA